MLALLQKGDIIHYKFNNDERKQAVVISREMTMGLDFHHLRPISALEPYVYMVTRYKDSFKSFEVVWAKDEDKIKEIIGDVEL